MTEIYPSPSSKEFIDDIKSVERMGRELVSLIEEKKPLEELIAFKDQCDAVLITLDAYANALLSTDTENTEYIKAVGDVENAAVMYQQAEDVFLRSVAKRKDEFNSPVLKPWRKYLEDILVEESHLMSPEEESLAAELSRSGSSAWERRRPTLRTKDDLLPAAPRKQTAGSSSIDLPVGQSAFRKEFQSGTSGSV